MSITAMKQALAALESCDTGDYSTGHVIHPSFNEKDVDVAITALRAAIEQAEKAEPVAIVVDCDGAEAIINCPLPIGTDIFTHPSQPPEGWQLPEKQTLGLGAGYEDAAYVSGWNDCIDSMLAAAPKPGENHD